MRRAAIALPLVASILACASAARADSPTDLESLLEEKVVSTASKAPETAESAPATSTVITAEDLRRYGIRSLDEALNYLAMGIVVENTYHDVEIGARGAHFADDFGDHVLLLVNGHTMNEQWGGTGYYERGTGIPFELIDHIEVILGPGSVLYGSNAMMAVINIVTKRAKDWDGFHAVIESELPISIRTAAGVGKEFKLFGKSGEVTLELEYFAQNGPSLHFAAQTVPGTNFRIGGTPTDVWGGVADKSNYAQLPTGYLRVILGNLEVNVRAELWKRASPQVNLDTFDDPNTYEVDRWLTGDVKYRAVLSSTTDLVSRLYADSYDYREYYDAGDPDACNAGMALGCEYRLYGISRWVGLEEQLSIDWLHDGRITTLLGIDARLREVGSKTDYVELETNRTDGSYSPYDLFEKALGAYGQQVLRPVKEVALNGGLRLDVDDRFGAHASPRFAASYEPWRGGTLKGIYSEAFRAPSAYERYYSDPGGQLAAPNLQPETVQSLEATFDQRIRAQHLLFGVFRTDYSNLVESRALTDAQVAAAKADHLLSMTTMSATQYRNVSSVNTWGFNAALEGTLVNTHLRYGATFTAAIAKSYDTPTAPALPVVEGPQVSGNAKISYEFAGALPTVGLVGRLVGTQAGYGAFEGVYKPEPYAPAFVETRVTLSGKVPWIKGLSYRATADYFSTPYTAYTVGPATLPNGSAAFLPVDRFRTGVGLSYDRGL